MTKRRYSDIERRSFVRIEANNPISYRTPNHHINEGLTVNLSGRGIMFYSQQSHQLGEKLDITIESLSPSEPPLNATILIKRVMQERSDYKVAGEFIGVR
jgi:c-di-GMP-binding flagellar brake protein YcgR|tara:strand:- start:1257 stop:1556 length:300 start_codon:yes stop_codon:yes gene_type:complete